MKGLALYKGRQLLREYLGHCPTYLEDNPRRHKPYGSLQSIRPPSIHFHTITMDFITALPETKTRFNKLTRPVASSYLGGDSAAEAVVSIQRTISYGHLLTWVTLPICSIPGGLDPSWSHRLGGRAGQGDSTGFLLFGLTFS